MFFETMLIFEELDQVDLSQEIALTIGGFDGIHVGHQHLINSMMGRARENHRLGGLITFEPHPKIVLRPDTPFYYLTPLEEKLSLVSELGLDFVVIMAFTAETVHTLAEDFVHSLRQHLRLREVWVGPDFALGYERQGDIPFLRKMGKQLDFTVQVVEPILVEGEIVSSTRIRRLLARGQIEKAARLLGRWPALTGEVVPGVGTERELGVLTANLLVDSKRAIPASGVYAVQVYLGPEVLDGITDVEGPPPRRDGGRIVKTHILDFEGDLLGQTLKVEFTRQLRPEMWFSDPEARRAQMEQDIRQVRQLLSERQDFRIDSQQN
ncbi:MAG: riboflavin biosynthesis protein RibF [Anaerolineae bacterium]